MRNICGGMKSSETGRMIALRDDLRTSCLLYIDKGKTAVTNNPQISGVQHNTVYFSLVLPSYMVNSSQSFRDPGPSTQWL